jgi:hypothetical protein
MGMKVNAGNDETICNQSQQGQLSKVAHTKKDYRSLLGKVNLTTGWWYSFDLQHETLCLLFCFYLPGRFDSG